MSTRTALVRLAAAVGIVFALLASSALGLPPLLGNGFSWSAGPSTGDHYDAACTSAQDVWVACDEGLMHSADRGSTWTTATTTGASVQGVSFADASHGWLSGYSGTIRHTSDGGQTWDVQTSPLVAALGRVRSFDASHAWIPVVGTSDRVLRTVDGGDNWLLSSLPSASASMRAVSFSDTHNGWAVGTGGVIVRSTNGGETWTSQTSGTSATIYDVSAISATEAWACSDGGRFLHTIDGGLNWSPYNHVDGMTIWSVKFISASEGWATSWDRVYHTTDSGVTWQTASTANSKTVLGVAAVPGDPWTVYFPSWTGILKYRDPSAPALHRVIALAGPHGSVTPTAAQICVDTSPSPEFTFTSDAGYHISDITYNGGSIGVPSSYQILGVGLLSVTQDATLAASFMADKARVTVSRTPAPSSKTYKRRRGSVTFKLSAKLNGAKYYITSSPITLQSSKNGRTWKTVANLKTNSAGNVSRSIKAKKRGTTYYRWKIGDTSRHFAATSSKFKAVVK
jgi:photosystem II stability/assembly factor-like uncharacterized protein